MKNSVQSFLISIALHAALILLAFLGWMNAPASIVVSSVPVEIISDMPSRERVATPVDELAVKEPEPIPAPDVPEPVKPAPVPPVPAPPKPQPKPAPVKQAPPVDKNGLKKPQPQKKPEPDILGGIIEGTPPRSKTRRTAPATQASNGRSNSGGPVDADLKNELSALTQRLSKLWLLNCDVPGSRDVSVEVRFTLSPNGRVTDGPTWLNRRSDPVWQAGANLALAAVNKGQPNAFLDLPEGLYNRPIKIIFDARKACQGR